MFSSSFLSKLGFVKKSFRYFYFNPEMSAASEIHKPILYGDTISPPVRFVMMTASYLEMELKFHEINLFRGENKSDFYSKINPLQKVPALSIGEETIRDSHAIALYLCKISPEQNLYPSDDAVAKAKVDEMMFFNAGALFPLDSAILSQYFAGNWPVSEEQIKQWNVLLDYLETILTKNQWLTGPKMMLCDICCAATVSSLRLLVPPEDRHKRVNEWLKQMQLLPFYKINTDGLDQLKYFIEKQKA